jgi:hypothetical protein
MKEYSYPPGERYLSTAQQGMQQQFMPINIQFIPFVLTVLFIIFIYSLPKHELISY